MVGLKEGCWENERDEFLMKERNRREIYYFLGEVEEGIIYLEEKEKCIIYFGKKNVFFFVLREEERS